MVANTLNPRARALAGALRKIREAKSPKVSMNALARILGESKSTVSYWETGKRIPSTEDVASYLTALGVVGTERETILDLARGATEADWLTVGIPGISQQLAGVLACERTASAITNWSIGMVPGILQTSDYAREIMGQASPDAEAKVALRLSRRDALTRRGAVRFTALLGEMALRQIIGGDEVMVDQLRHLLTVAELDTVTLLIVPIGNGWHPGLIGPFVLYDFPAAPSIVHLESHRSSAFVYDEEVVDAFKEAADKVRQAAMTSAQSVGFIAEAITAIERRTGDNT